MTLNAASWPARNSATSCSSDRSRSRGAVTEIRLSATGARSAPASMLSLGTVTVNVAGSCRLFSFSSARPVATQQGGDDDERDARPLDDPRDLPKQRRADDRGRRWQQREQQREAR